MGFATIQRRDAAGFSTCRCGCEALAACGSPIPSLLSQAPRKPVPPEGLSELRGVRSSGWRCPRCTGDGGVPARSMHTPIRTPTTSRDGKQCNRAFLLRHRQRHSMLRSDKGSYCRISHGWHRESCVVAESTDTGAHLAPAPRRCRCRTAPGPPCAPPHWPAVHSIQSCSRTAIFQVSLCREPPAGIVAWAHC